MESQTLPEAAGEGVCSSDLPEGPCAADCRKEIRLADGQAGWPSGEIPSPRPIRAVSARQTPAAPSDAAHRQRQADTHLDEPVGSPRYRGCISDVRTLAAGKLLQVHASGVPDRCALRLSSETRRSTAF